MTNKQIARHLRQTASLIELTGGNTYRARAYGNAARRIDDLDAPVTEYAQAGRLTELEGIGAGMAEEINALLEGGSTSLQEELLEELPSGLPELLRVKGLGVKKVRKLWQEGDVTSLDELEFIAQSGRLAQLDGFGAKTQENVLENIRLLKRYRKKRRYKDALDQVTPVLERLRKTNGVSRAELAGALRRQLETVEQADVIVTGSPQAVTQALAPWLEEETPRPQSDDLLFEGALPDGLPLNVRAFPAEHFGTAWWWLTGSEAHCAAFRAAHGAPDEHANERDLYAQAGLDFIEPELREGNGELEAAQDHTLPDLITTGDLQGALHNHSTYSDGAHSLHQMAEAARAMGLSYLGICDHSRSLKIASGLSIERVQEQQEEIRQLNKTFADSSFRIFSGIESDILNNGDLDYPEDILATFDFVVASVHSGLSMDQEKATERIIRAVKNPYTSILGHATGRLLLTREGYPLDHQRVIEACAAHDVAIELNANPYRLDMDWRYLRAATRQGVLVSINPDAHSIDELGYMKWGVNVARKGWLTARHCLNAKPLTAFSAWLNERHPAPA